MEDEFRIKIFGNDDVSLKLLGELLSNDTSRKIMRYLINDEAYTNEIAKKLDLKVSLVIHHLKKLEELGLLEIANKKIVKKGKEHRYFKMNPYIFVAPGSTSEEILSEGIAKFFFEPLHTFGSLLLLPLIYLNGLI